MRLRGLPFLLGTLASVFVMGCASHKVVRVVDGVARPGRFISPYSYAIYAQAREASARAEPCVAAQILGKAVGYDSSSVELWTRRGEALCACGRSGAHEVSFRRAQELDADYSPLWLAQAQCFTKHGKLNKAVVAARRASELDTQDVGTQLMLLRLLRRNGSSDEALRRALELAVVQPHRGDVLASLVESAREAGHVALAEAVQRRQRQLPSEGKSEFKLGDMQRALVEGDAKQARSFALQLGMSVNDFAAYALLLGRPKLAWQAASLRLAAQPDNVDAWVLVMLAADLGGVGTAQASQWGRMPKPAAPMSRLAQLMFAELLQRRVSVAAAARWISGASRGTQVQRGELCDAWTKRLAPEVRGAVFHGK